MKGKKEINQLKREIRKGFMLQNKIAAAKTTRIKMYDDHPRIGLINPNGKNVAITTAIMVAAVRPSSNTSVPLQIIGLVHLGNKICRSI